ncbi:hypothetical protein CARUB_v10022251mg [Capsella rubella]|uniref:Major facilitator superfamily (MFS) profile domain-containing protein n=2 Tax=Capsella rubella TaxID=81985 RepID=R0I9A1_9BRAS|nr:hypothetical protein CARUB_v10022251mg [Capsella rubella]
MDNEGGAISSDSTMRQRKPLGWKAMPYIIGNETLERLATFGLMANFMVYMVREYHMDQVQAATLINTWSALTNFAPIIGAFISDSYAGKFNTIVFGSIAELLGMSVLTFTSLIPNLRPPPCSTADQITGTCIRYSSSQLYVLLSGLFLLSVGTGGIRSSSVPFSLDQFDDSTEEGREGRRSFFSWYYTTHTIVQLISMTLVLYVQNNISWAIGFAIPTVLNLFALVLLFVGTRFYVFVKPEGSVFSGIVKVLVAAYKKRNERSPSQIEYYRPLLETDVQSNKLVLTDQFRFLNKAGIVMNNEEANEEWRICTVRQIEAIKSVFSIIPIFASSIIGFLAMNQQQTFTVSQALKMDLQFLGTSYQIPPASITVISLLTIGIWLPFYETVLVRHIQSITNQEGGISLLQKVGIGNIFSISTMFISGILERKRRDLSLTGVNISVFWLAPQQVLMGFYQVFTIVGLTEFFTQQVPINMRSIGNSLLYLGLSLASYLSSAMVSIVHSVTARGGRQSWLTDDIDTSKLDYFYYFIAALSTLNLIFFLWCARRYRYRNMSQI